MKHAAASLMPVSRVPDFPVANASASSRAGRGEILILIACVLVIAFYAWTAAPSRSDWGNVDARGAYYNLLVDGFSAGQLNLKTGVPPGLAALSDPYDPQANRVYRVGHHLHDTSYHRGRLYIYYGVTPALVLFGPYHWLTGGYLFNKQALFVFAAIGFLASVLLVRAVWRRYFPTVPAFAVMGGTVALGLANSVPALLRVPGICEVAIGCAYAFVMLACLFVWQTLHDERRAVRWLAGASLAYGLAVGARPSVLFGAVILVVPVVVTWRRHQQLDTRGPAARLLLAALVPIVCIGLGLALYNHARFGDIFEFGQRYQLAGDRQDDARHFSLTYLWFNFRLYFLSFVPWTQVFPFVQDFVPAAAPAGHAVVESARGIFSNTPFALFAFATGLAGRKHLAVNLRWFLAGIAALFLTSALILSLFYGTVLRYQVEFHPTLVLLACVGVLLVEHDRATNDAETAHAKAGATGRFPLVGRGLWIAALIFSVAFSVLDSIKMLAEELNKQGVMLAQQGRKDDAIQKLEAALRIKRDLVPAHSNLGVLHLDAGNARAAAEHFAAAVAADPRGVDALNGQGRALAALGKLPEAAEAFRRAVEVQPGFAPAHVNLALVLQSLGRHAEALQHFETAVASGFDSPGLRESMEAARAAARPNAVAPR